MNFKFQVSGMSCVACQARVERAARAVPGVIKADVNLLQHTLIVQGASTLKASAVISAVEQAGYEAREVTVSNETNPDLQEAQLLKKRFVKSLVLLIPLLFLAMGPMIGLSLPAPISDFSLYIQFGLTLCIVWFNRSFFSRGIRHLFSGAPTMDSLVALGSGAALLSGGIGFIFPEVSPHVYFESAAMILTLVTLGKWLEARAKEQTTRCVTALVELLPKQALVRREGKEMSVAPAALVPGDLLIWRAGQRAAADGIVRQGSGAVDESALTGESIPQDKFPGQAVSAGSLLVSGYLEVCIERSGKETTLAKMISLVQEAASGKAPIARIADRVSAVFVPIVLGIAVITCVGWLLAGQTISQAITASIAVLVISCPCALGLATPTAIMVGTGQAAKNGILVKSAAAFERACHVRAVVLDKTGTVTTGNMQVAQLIPAQATEEELVKWAASLEKNSHHPFAQALLAYAQKQPYALAETANFVLVPGRGVQATSEGEVLLGGNSEFMKERGVSVPEIPEQLARAAAEGCTPLFFAKQGNFLGSIWFRDSIKSTAAQAVSLLKSRKIRVLLVTGDNAQTASYVARQVGIAEVKAGVLPQEKEALIRQLQTQGMTVAMVGDGINDAPALTRADVGIALGAGTDVAVESADIVLMQEDLRSVAGALSISRAVFYNIRQNLFWAFFYNIVGIPLAAGVFYPFFGWQLSPMFAAAAMSLSSVCVVMNALRLRFFKLPYEPKQEEKRTMEKTLVIEGMVCGHCAAHVERALNALPGVQATVDLQHKTALVRSAQALDDETLRQAVQNAGYEVISIQG